MINGLLLHEIGHALIYLCFTIPVFLLVKNKKSILKYFVTGAFVTMFMDLDHFFDYFLQYGWSFSVIGFLQGKYFLDTGRVYVLAHAWEYVLLLLLFTVLIKNRSLKYYILFIVLGIFVHLFWDTLYYGFSWDFYSLYNRVSVGFNLNKL